MNKCLEVIRKACIIENESLSIRKRGKITPLLSIHIGQSLIDYAELSGQTDILSAGLMIFNSQVQNTAQFDLRSIAEIYAVIEKPTRIIRT